MLTYYVYILANKTKSILSIIIGFTNDFNKNSFVQKS